jgi:hypothetical protein
MEATAWNSSISTLHCRASLQAPHGAREVAGERAKHGSDNVAEATRGDGRFGYQRAVVGAPGSACSLQLRVPPDAGDAKGMLNRRSEVG